MTIFNALTESTYYVLMAFYQKETFGKEIVTFVSNITDNRINMGPGTLYTILSKLESDKYIVETHVEGRKRSYIITDLGRTAFEYELVRLQEILNHGLIIKGANHEN